MALRDWSWEFSGTYHLILMLNLIRIMFMICILLLKKSPGLDQSYTAPSLYHYHDITRRSKVSPEVLQIRTWNKLDVHYGISN